jgi:hypothetical protein
MDSMTGYLRQKGLVEPSHDKEIIDESLAPATTVVYYYRQGILVAQKNITVNGAITTVEVITFFE